MLPNTKNNSDQVKRMFYSKIKVDHATKNAETAAKKLQELKELFSQHSKHSPTDVFSNVFDRDLSQSQLDDIKTAASSRKKYVYPFILDADDEEANKSHSDKGDTNAPHHICVFRVFDSNGQSEPFLQFKLQQTQSDGSPSLGFPTFESPNESTYKSASDQTIKKLFPEAANKNNIKFRCTRTDPVTGKLYAIYEDTETSAKTSTKPDAFNDDWWWGCVHEIMNRNKILSIDVHATVVELFEHVPSIMFLYDAHTGDIMETPHVLYSGITEGSSVDEMALLGPRKLTDNTFLKGEHSSIIDPNERRIYGSQYYLYEYENVFRSACYTTRDATINPEYVKRTDPPHVFRYAVFLGNTNITVFDTNNTTTNQSIDGFRDYFNTSWHSKGCNSIHHGEYAIPAHKRIRRRSSRIMPVFCVCNIERIIKLGHYQINPKSVPVKYSDDIESKANYEIM
jgi:hypothetical protein